MRNTLKNRIVVWAIKKANLINLLSELKENTYIDECLKRIKGEGFSIYPESVIHNLQNNPNNIVIGQGSHIRGELLIFPYGGRIKIGDNCYIGEGTKVWSGENIEIGNNVGISHNINIVDFAHETNHLKRAEGVQNIFKYGHSKEKGDIPTAPIIIEDYVAIYPNSSILRGVKIGKGAIISTGSVVMNDVPAFSIVMGNPARVMGKLASVD